MGRHLKYGKGFLISRHKVSAVLKVDKEDLAKMYSFMNSIIDLIDDEAYAYLGSIYEHDPVDGRPIPDLVLVLAEGNDREDLEKKDLGEIDETIKRALPYVLEGPAVWELW